jgi:hypothetical protein
MDTSFAWGLGLAFALGAGQMTAVFKSVLEKKCNIKTPPKRLFGPVEEKFIPGWLTGLIERLFFTLLIAFEISGTGIAMVAWITVKMLQKWHGEHKNYSFLRLLSGMVSMLFALVGGLICSGRICISFL